METNAKIKPLNKQETLEEAAEKYINTKNPQWTPYHRKSFEDGAKWQQTNSDKKYTEEDLRNAIREGRNSVHFENDGSWWEDKTVEEDFINSLNKQD
jgi:hypothetical protein